MAARAARNFLEQTAYPILCEGLAIVGRPLLLSRSEDMTALTATRSCLVLAPHPDDETLGCGATIARKRAAGGSVHVVIATDGRHWPASAKVSADALVEIREEETRRAGAILGLADQNITFLRFEDGQLGDNRRLLRDRLVAILDQTNPEEIFVPSIIDTHPDHRTLSQIGRQLAQARQDGSLLLYEYPVWFWDPRILRVRHMRKLRTRIVRMGEFRARKREAIAAYRSLVTRFIGEPGWTAHRSFLRRFLQPEEIFFDVSRSE